MALGRALCLGWHTRARTSVTGKGWGRLARYRPAARCKGKRMAELILLTIAFTGWVSFRYWQDRRKTRRAERRSF